MRWKTFAPEFLNRIDDVIVFNTLEKHDIDLIIEIELKKLYARLKLGYKLTLWAKAFIAEKVLISNLVQDHKKSHSEIRWRLTCWRDYYF
jgi:ATP-dependent Clp protease ATP-binding subunit ClpA